MANTIEMNLFSAESPFEITFNQKSERQISEIYVKELENRIEKLEIKLVKKNKLIKYL